MHYAGGGTSVRVVCQWGRGVLVGGGTSVGMPGMGVDFGPYLVGGGTGWHRSKNGQTLAWPVCHQSTCHGSSAAMADRARKRVIKVLGMRFQGPFWPSLVSGVSAWTSHPLILWGQMYSLTKYGHLTNHAACLGASDPLKSERCSIAHTNWRVV